MGYWIVEKQTASGEFEPIKWFKNREALERYAINMMDGIGPYLMVRYVEPVEYELAGMNSDIFSIESFKHYREKMQGAVSNIHYGGELSKIK